MPLKIFNKTSVALLSKSEILFWFLWMSFVKNVPRAIEDKEGGNDSFSHYIALLLWRKVFLFLGGENKVAL